MVVFSNRRFLKFPLLGGLLFFGIALSGCLGGPEGLLGIQNEKLPGTNDLPPVYFSTTGFLPQDYAASDFPRVVEVLLGKQGAEPNVGVTSKGGIFVTAFDSTLRSLDGGKTWKEVYNFSLAQGAPVDPFRTSDPMLWVDPDTDRIFTNHMFPVLACSSQIISDDGGESWKHYPASCGVPVVDHQKVITAKPRNPLLQPVGYSNLVYYCYNKLLSTNCAVSFDGGMHYELDQVVALATQCGGINGHPAASREGIVYVPLGNNCNTPHVGVSQDGGLTWTVHKFGSDVGVAEIDPEVTVTPDGTAYYYGRGKDGNGYLFRSRDHFVTVDGPFQVNPPDVKGVVFAGLTSGDDGRLAIAYLGNRESEKPSGQVPKETVWHLFLTLSQNADEAEPSFLTQQVTPPDDPVQRGTICVEGSGCGGDRNLLDFIDAVADKDGRVYVSFTDGCTTKDKCANNPNAKPEDSRDRAAAVAICDQEAP